MRPACPGCGHGGLRPLRTLQGRMSWCERCHGHWVTREAGGFLAPLLTQTVEALADHARQGRCPQGPHRLDAGQERCGECPDSSRRCPGCQGRLTPLVREGQPLELCPRCPGLWLEVNGLSRLRRAHPQPLSTALLARGLQVVRRRPGLTALGVGAALAGEATLQFGLERALVWLVEALGALF